MDKIRELFEELVNITYQARAAGELGLTTGNRIDRVIEEYEEHIEGESK